MRYPLIGRRGIGEINIPKLSGGINLRDSLTGIRDNQMTDSVNMWYKDGMLKTRPPLITNNSCLNSIKDAVDNEEITTRFHSDIKLVFNGFECICATNKRVTTDAAEEQYTQIDFELQATDKLFALPSIKNIKGKDITYFLIEFKNVLYCYISDYSIWKLEYTKRNEIGNFVEQWKTVNLSDCHIPTVMIHCKAKNGTVTGTQLDSFNMLTNSFKMIYSTVNISALVSGKTAMEYPLITINSLKNIKNTTFKARHTKIDGTVTEHTVLYNSATQTGTWYESRESAPADMLYMYVKIDKNKAVVGFSTSKGSSAAAQIGEADFVEDNLEITAIISNKDNLKLGRVFDCQKTLWFGGAASGIYSGSRLFLGNNKADEKSLVLWSDFNNPLYFPENCYAYVGDKASGVTAFSRQDDKLVIFKEKEIYYTYYSYNGVSAEGLINQAVVDYQANAVFFPMILINAAVGCDCPDSVQMCRNRLVWAHSEGKIYTLCKMNNYDEHTVYEISEMIKPRLIKYKDRLNRATSADFDGHYVLFLGDVAFVADYNSYGFQYAYSYSKTEDANALLPWYYWEFPFLKSSGKNDEYHSPQICMLRSSLLLRAYFEASETTKSGFVGFAMNENEISSYDTIFCNDFLNYFLKVTDNPINSSAVTKLFEPGNGIYNFNLESVALKCGSNNGAEITVELLSEGGSDKNNILIKNEYKSPTDIGFIRQKRISSTLKVIAKLAVKIECSGMLAIDGISLRYRLLGGAK